MERKARVAENDAGVCGPLALSRQVSKLSLCIILMSILMCGNKSAGSKNTGPRVLKLRHPGFYAVCSSALATLIVVKLNRRGRRSLVELRSGHRLGKKSQTLPPTRCQIMQRAAQATEEKQ